MRECMNCEKIYNEHASLAIHKNVYCTKECEQEFSAQLQSSVERSKAEGLIDSEGNPIHGTTYYERVNKILNAGGKLGIKFDKP